MNDAPGFLIWRSGIRRADRHEDYRYTDKRERSTDNGDIKNGKTDSRRNEFSASRPGKDVSTRRLDKWF